MIFCLSCKKHTNDINPIGKLTKNNKPYISAKCNICKKRKVNLFLLKILKEMDSFQIYLKISQYQILFFKDNNHLHFLYNEDILNNFF